MTTGLAILIVLAFLVLVDMWPRATYTAWFAGCTLLVMFPSHAAVPTQVNTLRYAEADHTVDLMDEYRRANNPLHLLPQHLGKSVPTAIAQAALVTELDPNLLATFANIESSMRADARNGRVKGLMQFTPPTWATMVARHAKRHGLTRPNIFNPYHNALLGGELMKDNAKYLERRLGRRLAIHEKYLAHLVSPLNAYKLIRAGGWRLAKDLVPTYVVAGNESHFYSKTGQAFTVAQFKAKIRELISTKRVEISQRDVNVDTCNVVEVKVVQQPARNHVLAPCETIPWGDRRRIFRTA